MAHAEGSRTLYPASYPGTTVCGTGANQGCRSNLDLQAGQKYLNRVNRRTFLYVYAQAGEYILLSSRNRANGGDIFVYNPQNFGIPGDETVPATADFTCSTTATGPNYGGGTRGVIITRANELAGPKSADGSTPAGGDTYAPCAYQAPSTGIYGVLISAATTGSGPNGLIDPPNISNDSVSAWDVTVRASVSSTTDINGRLFTYAWVGFTGGNNRPDYSTHYYVSLDGYRYWQELHGFDPNGYTLYANSLGFLDNGAPLYHDIRGSNPTVTDGVPPGITTQIAQYPHFFSDIDDDGPNNTEVNRVLTALNIPLVPPSPTVSNVTFTGPLPTNHTTPGVGGTFTFTTTDTITYQIVVSLNGVDFSANNLNNAVLTGTATGGTHVILWDGKNQNGDNFPESLSAYPFKVFGRAGEIHFPMVDDENNGNGSSKTTATFGGGPDLTALNGGNAGSSIVFFDDRGYITNSGTLVGNVNGSLCTTVPPQPAGPEPRFSLDGVNSTPNYVTHELYRWWLPGNNANGDCVNNAGFGDAKALNLWAYYSSPPQSNSLNIDPIIYDAATTVSAPTTATTGSTVQGAFTFSNNGNTQVSVTSYTLTVGTGCSPALTFTNLPSGAGTPTCSGGTYTFPGFPATIVAGGSILGANPLAPMNFSYIAPVTGPVVVTTNITISETDDYPPNNTATASTGFGQVDVATTVSVPASAVIGSTVNGTFNFANLGNDTALATTYSATFSAAGGTLPDTVTFASLPSGVTATYNPGTGVVTFTGLPTTLAAGQGFNFGFSYTMPATAAPIQLDTHITTTSSDANPANNDATGNTTTRQMILIGGALFRDNGTGIGGVAKDGIQDGTEPNANTTTLNGATVVILDDLNKVLAIPEVCQSGSILCTPGEWETSVPEGTNYRAYLIRTADVPTVGDTIASPVPSAPIGWIFTMPNINNTPQGTLGDGITGVFTPVTGMKVNFGVLNGACPLPN